jgi:hypothetical protein
MPALVAGIHAFQSGDAEKDVGGRTKSGHDGREVGQALSVYIGRPNMRNASVLMLRSLRSKHLEA